MGCNSSQEAVVVGGKRAPEPKKSALKQRSPVAAAPGAWVPLPMAAEVPRSMNCTRTSMVSVSRNRASVNATITTIMQARRLDLWSNDSDLASQGEQGGLTFAPHGDGASPNFSCHGADAPKNGGEMLSGGDELLQLMQQADSGSDRAGECGDHGATMADLAHELHHEEEKAEDMTMPRLPASVCLTIYTLAAHDLHCSSSLPSTNMVVRQWRTETAQSGGRLEAIRSEAEASLFSE